MAKVVRKVAVIGAGPAGLVSARFLYSAGFDVTVFERNERVGGVWVYREIPPAPPSPGAAVYDSLRTNLPTDIMGFAEFPDFTPDRAPTYPTHPIVLDYIERYAAHFKLFPLIRFRTEVRDVVWDEAAAEWVVTVRGEEGESEEGRFDAVVACGGNFYRRNMPVLDGENVFPGGLFRREGEERSVRESKVRRVPSGCG
ncbi:hypothetical protein BDK51DRAFT_47697 [Blyttiomyces helicus]|uniref:FAD/NAD(P)-binding domain-containing protein n=1 Tax=Blyttiomyces helicus TaxID=388810 RepID=A0A4V1IPJ2_9FUNG|nr:hypothetical protein BDK51DRAFT_47697 [Blyttiomyces helicus]|eukprot:RKO83247.1 hypothetical protein BDK51DRAFT_47697 [Blyttiomyces helicus]